MLLPARTTVYTVAANSKQRLGAGKPASCERGFTESFGVKTGVRQGCLLSPIIFLMVLDSVLSKTNNKPRGVQWTINERLEDIDFADDLCLISSKLIDMKEKIENLNKEGSKLGLKINERKTKEMRLNTTNEEEITVNGHTLERVEQFQYLGSLITKQGGTEEDVEQRIRKAKGVFAQLRSIWLSQELRRKTKMRIFESNVKSVLLYGCQTWKITKNITRKLQNFVNNCLRKIY